MKVKDIITSVFKEAEDDSKNLKLYYKTDILIQGFPEKEQPEEQPVQGEQPAQQEETLEEEIFKTSSEGVVSLPKEEADNIQTLEDLVDYLSDIKDGGRRVINDVAEEIILTLAGAGNAALQDIIHKGDKIIIDVDYGKNREDSIGIRVNKNPGSTNISLTMKKNGKIIPSDFDLNSFNRQLVYYRNSLFGE